MAVGSLFSKVAGFFYESEDAPVAERAAPERRARAGDSVAEVERALRKLGETGATTPVGLMKVIGLHDTKSLFGSRWPEVAEHVKMLAHAAIRDHITADDRWSQASDDKYLILFANPDPVAAHDKATLIARKITELLNQVLQGQSGLSLEAKLIEVSVGAGDTPILASDPVTIETPDARKKASGSVSGSRAEPDRPVEATGSRPESGRSFALSLDSEISKEIRDKAASIYADVRVGFCPVGLVAQASKDGYRCSLTKPTQDGGHLVGEAVYPRDDGGAVTSDLDKLALLGALTELPKLPGGDDSPRLVLPLHFGALRDPRNRQLIVDLLGSTEVLANMPLAIEMVCLSDTFSTAKLAEVRSFLRRLTKQLWVTVPLDGERLEALEYSGMDTIWTVLPRSWEADSVKRQLLLFTDRVGKMGARPGLHGVDQTDTIRLAIGSGFEMLTGDMVGRPETFVRA